MVIPEFLKPEFDKLAINGCIGSPIGRLAFGYIRVSGDEQAEDGRSGLPRQLAHIHEVACRLGYRIPWDMIFADDHTGFEFEGRPGLSQLRQELRSPNRRGHAVIIEHLDRLSRNADWHQGYLLDEMRSLNVQPLFWKEFSSRIERAVMGAIAQDGMEQAKQRMMEGNLYKARSGRVTARVPAYGYRLVDANGNESVAAKKETYYAIREEEAVVIRLIFRRVIEGTPMRRIALELEMAGIKPPKQYKHWELAQVRLFIKNEIYKGDFYAHRWEHTTVSKPSKDGYSTRTVKCKIERPREEWIHVSVPAVVTPEEWEMANRMLAQNQKTARRNAKNPYLLTGLVRCAYCGWKFAGTVHRKNKHGDPRPAPYRGYRCPHYSIRPKYLAKHIECRSSQLRCDVLDNAVWKIVCQALLEPQLLIEALDADATSERNRQLEEQIAYLQRELDNKTEDDEKLWKAYTAGAYDEHEFTVRRKLLKEEAARVSDELIRLRSEVLTQEQLEQRKTAILEMSAQMQQRNIPIDPPFEVKRQIIKLVVDEIILNVNEGWLELHGAVRGEFTIASTHSRVGIMATRLNRVRVLRRWLPAIRGVCPGRCWIGLTFMWTCRAWNTIN
jgi:site-specific DNA recombinase